MTAALPKTAEEIDACWDFNVPAESEQRFRALLDRSGPDSDLNAEIATQLARAAGLQGKYAEAHHVLDNVARVLPSTPSRLRARYLLERGRVLKSSGDPEAARPLFLEALDAARRCGAEFYAVDAAHMVAIVSPADEQIAWNRRALAMAEASADLRTRRWRGSLYNNLGWAHHGRGEFEEAVRCFEEALRAREEHGDAALIQIARWCVARGLRSLGRVEEALAIQRSLLAAQEHLGTEDREVYEELIACLTALGRSAQAQEYEARLASPTTPKA